MIGIMTGEDGEQIMNELTQMKAEIIQLRKDFSALVEELNSKKKG